MCGLAGIIGKYSSVERDLMLKSMEHRGPDSQNFFVHKNFCFMHALLKIMDLSDKSKQPMTDNITGNVVIFNGSIYNYKDLKKEFFSNENLKSNTDTEIILKLYSKFGLNFTDYIKGMFAIAIYDKNKNRILIVRDRVGIKPLFYFASSNVFIFASEIKTLLKNIHIKKSIILDEHEVVNFIAHRQLNGFSNTLIKNIKILEPGNLVVYDLNNKKFKIHKYINEKKSEFKKNDDEFEKIFDESINYHTITEHKKVACLLSGGLDSSLLSIILKNNLKNKEIHTFSSILNKPNAENKNIEKIVQDYKFKQHYIFEDELNFFSHHQKTIYDLDQPTPDASSTMHNFLCKKVSEHGFKVLFTGNGGDENFLGYSLHAYGYLADLLTKFNFIKFFKEMNKLKRFNPTKNIFLRSIKEIINIELLKKNKQFQLKKRIKHLNIDCDYKDFNFYKKIDNNILENIILNFKTHWGMQSFLDYEDKNSMAYGIECRVPFLYDDINLFASKLLRDRHFKNGTKSLLRNHSMMASYLKNKPKYAFASNLHGYLDKDINKMKEMIFYNFKNIPLINNEKLINLTNNKKNYDIFFRTYSYGLWYNNMFNNY